MRLPAEKVKAAILHPARDVREAAVYYFARSFSHDASVMPLVIQAIERFGFDGAFENHAFIKDLAQTAGTVRWFIDEIRRRGPPGDERERWQYQAFVSALVHADVSVLQRYEDEIVGLVALDDEARDAISERIWFPSRPPNELWRDLVDFSELHAHEESVSDEDFAFACRLAEASGRFPDQFADQVLSILSGETGFNLWMTWFAVRLAGEMKLDAAIPWLIGMLENPGDWECEQCHRALTKIGTEAVVTQLAKGWSDADWDSRMCTACILEDIPSDLTIQTGLDLLKAEADTEIKCLLLQAILFNFATEAIEPARQFILKTPLDPDVVDVRTALLIACKLLGERIPEFDAWQADAENDEEFRRRWYEKHPVTQDEEDWGSDVDSEEDGDDEIEETPGDDLYADENPESPGISFIGREPHTGRNDLCPCGSGKKFKRCCLRKVRIESESDRGHAAALSGVQTRRSPPKYPIGTIAHYGPDDQTTTKIVAGVIKREGAEAVIKRWVGTDVKDNPKVQRQLQQFFQERGVKSIVATDGNMGCPHEEGDDFPVGEDCPFCPFWKGKQGSACED